MPASEQSRTSEAPTADLQVEQAVLCVGPEFEPRSGLHIPPDRSSFLQVRLQWQLTVFHRNTPDARDAYGREQMSIPVARTESSSAS